MGLGESFAESLAIGISLSVLICYCYLHFALGLTRRRAAVETLKLHAFTIPVAALFSAACFWILQ